MPNSSEDQSAGQEPFQYGGQAVIEGVMMRGPQRMAVAVRRPEKGIVIHSEAAVSPSERPAFLRLPFIRGSVALYDSLKLGIGALIFSANQAAAAEDEELTRGEVALSMGIALAFAIGIFIVLPTVLIHFLKAYIESSLALNTLEGLVRLLLLVGYIAAIARIPDIQRVFEYHGAEHKVIHAYESGVSLSPEAAREFPPLHPRCGTSFLLFVALVSVFLYSFFGWPHVLERIAVRLLLLPIVAGAAYEVIKLAGRSDNPAVRFASVPGLWLQKLTTREPDDGQLEVAICALQAVLDPARRAEAEAAKRY